MEIFAQTPQERGIFYIQFLDLIPPPSPNGSIRITEDFKQLNILFLTFKTLLARFMPLTMNLPILFWFEFYL